MNKLERIYSYNIILFYFNQCFMCRDISYKVLNIRYYILIIKMLYLLKYINISNKTFQ